MLHPFASVLNYTALIQHFKLTGLYWMLKSKLVWKNSTRNSMLRLETSCFIGESNITPLIKFIRCNKIFKFNSSKQINGTHRDSSMGNNLPFLQCRWIRQKSSFLQGLNTWRLNSKRKCLKDFKDIQWDSMCSKSLYSHNSKVSFSMPFPNFPNKPIKSVLHFWIVLFLWSNLTSDWILSRMLTKNINFMESR